MKPKADPLAGYPAGMLLAGFSSGSVHIQQAIRQRQALESLRYRLLTLLDAQDVEKIERRAQEEAQSGFGTFLRRMEEAYRRAAAGMPPFGEATEEGVVEPAIHIPEIHK